MKFNEVTSMKVMFMECSSLKALPDISKWNTNSVNDKNDMFTNCPGLGGKIPDKFKQSK